MTTLSPFAVMLTRVRDGCPWFEDEWRRYQSSPKFVPQHTLEHVMHFGRFLALLAAEGESALVAQGMELLCELANEGGDFTLSIVAGAIFEAIQEEATRLHVSADLFEPFLTGVYLDWWHATETQIRASGRAT